MPRLWDLKQTRIIFRRQAIPPKIKKRRNFTFYTCTTLPDLSKIIGAVLGPRVTSAPAGCVSMPNGAFSLVCSNKICCATYCSLLCASLFRHDLWRWSENSWVVGRKTFFTVFFFTTLSCWSPTGRIGQNAVVQNNFKGLLAAKRSISPLNCFQSLPPPSSPVKFNARDRFVISCLFFCFFATRRLFSRSRVCLYQPFSPVFTIVVCFFFKLPTFLTLRPAAPALRCYRAPAPVVFVSSLKSPPPPPAFFSVRFRKVSKPGCFL